MKIPIRLKIGHTIQQPMAATEWTRGDVVDFVRAADDRAYAIVLTEFGEFEFVPPHAITYCTAEQQPKSIIPERKASE